MGCGYCAPKKKAKKKVVKKKKSLMIPNVSAAFACKCCGYRILIVQSEYDRGLDVFLFLIGEENKHKLLIGKRITELTL